MTWLFKECCAVTFLFCAVVEQGTSGADTCVTTEKKREGCSGGAHEKVDN